MTAPLVAAARSGARRGVFEFQQSFITATDIFALIFPNVILLTVMIFMRGSTVGTTGFSLGTMSLSSVIGMSVAFNGMMTVMQHLAVEREDGTLLRAKAIPNGMFGYLVGKIVLIAGLTVVTLAMILVPGLVLFDGIALNTAGAWLTLAWVLVLGLVATMPIGAILGSMFENPRTSGLMMLPVMGLVAVSGIFTPLSEAPQWMQLVGQVFPIYWLGLGMRSAMLPDGLAVVEIGGSWRHWETVGVLGLWAVIGLVLAPAVLRRMARRESGAAMAERREKALQRVN
ncbi:ABC transporter permease [Kibdelosporangium phytohabitans]|uniref:ABC transporter n=1 Tax=Kibdelosporangium phytohabitans TaxID=860235 RepID=A0A0N9HMQ2_9PSEU|nr:ABC transporter permease [Kibdelosporangium phytohabitans]ALG08097.1 ABC transporter [Kibdelosporangium phytohabitans]MBE1470927.1 ABC-2 type transport system permease protein [Kibdelosporangium phytohabitans]